MLHIKSNEIDPGREPEMILLPSSPEEIKASCPDSKRNDLKRCIECSNQRCGKFIEFLNLMTFTMV